jgi:Diguanylate cyclase, GGDEF domain
VDSTYAVLRHHRGGAGHRGDRLRLAGGDPLDRPPGPLRARDGPGGHGRPDRPVRAGPGNGAGAPAATTQVSVPLLAQGRVLGVLSLYDREDGEPFTSRTPFCADGLRLTVSIGVACFPEQATAPDELLRAADEALYEAKLQGRDRMVTAGPRLLPLTARPGQVKGRAARVE